jgi:hypothetical protein
LHLACPASQVPPALRIEGDTSAADLGSAVHEQVLGRIVGTAPDLAVTAARWRVDVGELAPLVGRAWRQWERVSQWFPEPAVEVYLWAELPGSEGLRLTGHADVLSRVGDQVRIYDLKTGWLEGEHRAQLQGYGWLALQLLPECTSAYTMVHRVREGSIDPQEYSRAELDAWPVGVRERLGETETYHAGAHCGHCPRALECDTKDLYLKVGLFRLRNDNLDRIPREPRQRGQILLDLLGICRSLQRESEDLMTLIRADVRAHGGRLGDLVLTRQPQKRIDFARGMDALEEMVGTEQLMEIVTLSNKAAEEGVKAAAPRGQKGRAVQELWRRLAEAGAVITTEVERLEVRPHGDGNGKQGGANGAC